MLVTVYNSKMDRNGNTYWAIHKSDLGCSIQWGTIASDNIDTRYLKEKGIELVYKELPIREFNKLTKHWEYFGCRWEEIKENLGL